MNNDNNQFTIEVSSDLDYEKMVVNLNFRNNQVAILNCDKGDNSIEIQFLDNFEEKIIWTFDYYSFINALSLAVTKLKQANGARTFRNL